MAVYFARDPGNGLIKIGYSEEPLRRRSGLNTGNVDRLELLGQIENGDEALESQLQFHFRAAHEYRGGGIEWFKPVPELMNLIETNRIPAFESEPDYDAIHAVVGRLEPRSTNNAAKAAQEQPNYEALHAQVKELANRPVLRGEGRAPVREEPDYEKMFRLMKR